MNKKIILILLITIVSLIGVPQIQANKNIFNNFTKYYNVPNSSDAKLNTCITCMSSTSPPSWNKYGLDLKNNTAFNRNDSIPAMKNIEPLDSDGDKFINIDEIHNSTFPGNESDLPSTSTPAGTEPKPAYANMNGLSTVIVFAIVYVFTTRKRKD